jgi:lysophospholipase L1-like esterase
VETLKIVCIGNSIVNGFPLKRSQCFVSLWRESSGHEIINKGENGDISSNIVLRFQRDVVAHKPAAVVVLTGTNDFIHQLETPVNVLGYMSQMVQAARSYAMEPILMTPLLTSPAMAGRLWIPDVDYNTVNDKLRVLRSLMLEYGENNKVRIIDAQMEFASLCTEVNEDIYLIDGLHPTAEGHKAIAGFFSF